MSARPFMCKYNITHHLCTRTHARTHPPTHTHTHIHTHRHRHTHTGTHTHTHTHTHKHTHTHAQEGPLSYPACHEDRHQAAGLLRVHCLRWHHLSVGGRFKDPAVLRVSEIRGGRCQCRFVAVTYQDSMIPDTSLPYHPARGHKVCQLPPHHFLTVSMHACADAQTHIHTHVNTRTHTQTNAHVHTHVHTRTHAHAHTHMHTLTYTRSHTHARLHIRIHSQHTDMHSLTHTHVRTLTHARSCSVSTHARLTCTACLAYNSTCCWMRWVCLRRRCPVQAWGSSTQGRWGRWCASK